MSTILVELYDALKDAGASDDKARAAAKSVAVCGSGFAKFDADLLVIKWMLGATFAAVFGVFLKSFFG